MAGLQPGRPGSRRPALWFGVAVAAAWIGWQAWVHRAHFVDDAFIGLRYARNLVTGHGLVFNPGEWVEGLTNVGWVLPLAGLGALLGGIAPLPALAKGAGLLCLLGAVLLAARAVRRLAPEASPAELVAVPLLAATQPELTYFAIAGMETGLAALLLVLGLWCLLPERPRLPALATVGAVLFTVRPETLPIVPAVLVLLAVGPAGTRLPRGRLLGAGGLFALLVATVTALRLATYGAALPNTFVAKAPPSLAAVGARLRGLLAGSEVNVPLPYSSTLLLVAGGMALLWALGGMGRRDGTAAGSTSEARPSPAPWIYLGVAVAVGLAFGIYAPADWTGMGRYFGPYVPLAAILLVRGAALAAGGGVAAFRKGSPPPLASIDRAAGGRVGAWTVAVLASLVVVLNLWRTGEHLSPAALRATPGFILASEELVPPARWIDDHLPEDAVIAARRIGALGYFGRRPVFDYAFGLTDPRVARTIRRHGERFHTPAAQELADLWRTVRPDYLLEDLEVVGPLLRDGNAPAATTDLLGRNFRIHGLRYEVVRTFRVGDVKWVLSRRLSGD